jgi:hypothetical protein
MSPAIRAELVRLLASALVADVRAGTTVPAASGASSPGTARPVVGRLAPSVHPRELLPLQLGPQKIVLPPPTP